MAQLRKECGEHGAVLYTWPGKDQSVACIEHATELQGIANAMGMHLQLIMLSSDNVSDPLNWPACQQKIKDEE